MKLGKDKISIRFFEYAYAAKAIRNQGGFLPRGCAEFEIVHLLLINKMLDADIFRWAKQVSNVQEGSWIMKEIVEHRMISSLVKRDALRYLASRLS